MKLLSRRAKVLVVMSLLLIFGLFSFITKYTKNASMWVQHPSNQHLYKNGKRIFAGTIVDRKGNILVETVDQKIMFNKSKAVRTALMHATGDLNGNVVTGAQVAFGDHLSGWDFMNGLYRYPSKSEKPAHDLILTLDSDICTVAYNALNGRKGAVGVYNYLTGEIICMASSPSFDPQYPPVISDNTVKYEGAYINRFISSIYAPGSVFKLVTAAAAIDHINDYDKKIYHCDGKTEIEGDIVTCPRAHGDVTLEQALSSSCNAAFAKISLELGGKTLQEYAETADLNSSLNVNGINTGIGIFKASDAVGSNLGWAGIGQYSNMVNPLNFMTYVGAIANKGVRVNPVIISDGSNTGSKNGLNKNQRILSEKTAESLGEMMRNNVLTAYGEENYKGLNLCAKTGTAEVGENKKPHSWFVGYMDSEDTPFAFVVIIENGGTGSRVAGPVAAKVLNAAVNSMTH